MKMSSVVSNGDDCTGDGDGCSVCAVADSHCHVHLRTETSAKLAQVLHCIYGTEPDDWPTLSTLVQASIASSGTPDASLLYAVGFGVHPWHAPAVQRQLEAGTSEWKEALRERLCVRVGGRWPLVGEIGLDGAATDRETGAPLDPEAQDIVFKTQWQWAARLSRGVSVHCVRSHGALFDLCRSGEAAERAQTKRNKARARRRPQPVAEEPSNVSKEEEEVHIMPPVVALHSYSGSADIATQLLRMSPDRYFFGFSTAVNGRNWPAVVKVIAKLPRNRILAESDLEDEASAQSACDDIVRRIASDVWHCTVEEARKTLEDNLKQFLAKHDEASASIPEEKQKSIAASLS